MIPPEEDLLLHVFLADEMADWAINIIYTDNARSKFFGVLHP